MATRASIRALTASRRLRIRSVSASVSSTLVARPARNNSRRNPVRLFCRPQAGARSCPRGDHRLLQRVAGLHHLETDAVAQHVLLCFDLLSLGLELLDLRVGRERVVHRPAELHPHVPGRPPLLRLREDAGVRVRVGSGRRTRRLAEDSPPAAPSSSRAASRPCRPAPGSRAASPAPPAGDRRCWSDRLLRPASRCPRRYHRWRRADRASSPAAVPARATRGCACARPAARSARPATPRA